MQTETEVTRQAVDATRQMFLALGVQIRLARPDPTGAMLARELETLRDRTLAAVAAWPLLPRALIVGDRMRVAGGEAMSDSL